MKSDDDYLETCLKESNVKPGKKVPASDLVKQCIKLYFPLRGCATLPAPGTAEQMHKLEQLPFEALNPKFRGKFPLLVQRIGREIKPKTVGAHRGAVVPVDGPRLVQMMKTYLDSINKGALPDVDSAWQNLQKASCMEAVTGAKKAFRATLEKGRAALVGTHNRSLDLEELDRVTKKAFQVAYEFYKQNAVGEANATQTYMHQLTRELAEYKSGKDGTKVLKSGILKEFTDANYKLALSQGEVIVNEAVKTLSETQHPDFETFKAEREKTVATVNSKLKTNVAFAELSKRLLTRLEGLSTKKGLQFDISASEKEKEKILAESALKEIENERMNAELREALINKSQVKSNLQDELNFLREQSEKEFREWKERALTEANLREQQIIADLKNGFDRRAEALRRELKEKSASTLKMILQMQRDANERQAKLTQLLTLARKPTPQPKPTQSSCFSGDTLVLMANGESKRIQDIQPGDEVRIDEKMGKAKVIYNEQRETGGRALFGFNDLVPFFTDEHIMVTKSGLRCLNVEALIKEDPSYQHLVQPLSIGDEILSYSLQEEKKLISDDSGILGTKGIFQIIPQKILSFSKKEVDATTPVYNIVLSTGHTFFANGIYVSDLFPRLDRFAFSFKMLHWLWRERGQQIQDCFEKQLGRDKQSTSFSSIHQDPLFQDLFTRLKDTVDDFIQEQQHQTT
jgi:hypothetical protein